VEAGIRVAGPSAKAAEIEGSKAFSKDLMRKYHIPTAEYAVFTEYEPALEYLKQKGAPIVVKADGLAAGKGVLLCQTLDEAVAALDQVMKQKAFGAAGDRVVIEEYLTGEEASFLVFTDGRTVIPLPTSQDHKAVFDGDKGPNTGGMGAYSPAPVVTPALERDILKNIIYPTIEAMGFEGRPYKGVLYAGLMMTQDGPKVLEYNARFGDPECQPLLMRLKSDLLDILEAIADDRLDLVTIEWDPRAALCLVMASGGYPGDYEKGHVIQGLDEAAKEPDVMVFHAGTRLADGRAVTSGGRVLGVTALGDTGAQAIAKAYVAAHHITWPGVHYRRDIGRKALGR
jgi:phosphoribosylamine--glycine ligase